MTKSRAQPVRVEVSLGIDRLETQLKDLERGLEVLERQQQSWVDVIQRIVQANGRLVNGQHEINNMLINIDRNCMHTHRSLQALHHCVLGNAQALERFRSSSIAQLNEMNQSLYALTMRPPTGFHNDTERRSLVPQVDEQSTESEGLGTNNEYEVRVVANHNEGRGNLSDFY